MKRVTQTTSIPEYDECDTVAVTLEDDAAPYKCPTLVIKDTMLSTALDSAERFLYQGFNVILDDINKFQLIRKCHMERGSMMKAWLVMISSTLEKLRNKVYLRTDERLESLDKLIEKVFPE